MQDKKGEEGEQKKRTTYVIDGEEFEYIPPARGIELQKLIFKNNTRATGGGLKWTQEEELKKQRG